MRTHEKRALWITLLLLAIALASTARGQETAGNSPSQEAAKQEAKPAAISPDEANPLLKLMVKIQGLDAEMRRIEARYPKAQQERQALLAQFNDQTKKLQTEYKAEGWFLDDDLQWVKPAGLGLTPKLETPTTERP